MHCKNTSGRIINRICKIASLKHIFYLRNIIFHTFLMTKNKIKYNKKVELLLINYQ